MRNSPVKSSLFAVLCLFISGLILASCSSGPESKENDPEHQFKIASDYDKDERYEEAIRRYQEIKNKFPYSKYALLSELAVADAYFKQESYPEAQVAYSNFKEMHPKHARIDYVIYQIGLSYYNQLPTTADRDLSLANQALSNFDDLLNHYPNSENNKDAQEKKLKTQKLLAEKEIYIADFYFKKSQWLSAMTRYEAELKKYPGQGLEAKALARAALCAARLENMEHARALLADLKTRFPDSSEISAVEKELK
jgi:outer membrane protein assembly factor BamD